MNKLILVVFILLLSCSKEEDKPKYKVLFFTTSFKVKITSDFGDFQISKPSVVSPLFEEDEIYLQTKIFQLEPGEYKVHMESMLNPANRFDKIFSVRDKNIRLDCSQVWY